MALLRNLVSCLAVAVMLMTVAKATSYTVGDEDGWGFVPDYAEWVSDKSFKVGDKLVFNYFPSHDVLEVSEIDYDLCTTSKPIKTYTGGRTTITLTAAGKKFFICGTTFHCDQGQKLAVETLGSSASPPPPVASSPPPPKPAPIASSPPPPIIRPPPPKPAASPPPPIATSPPPPKPATTPPPPIASSPPPTKPAIPPYSNSANRLSLAGSFTIVLMMLAAI